MASGRSEEINVNLTKRFRRIEGQMRGLQKMVDEDRDTKEIMNQIQSGMAAFKSIWDILAAHYIENAISKSKNKSGKKAVLEIIQLIKELK